VLLSEAPRKNGPTASAITLIDPMRRLPNLPTRREGGSRMRRSRDGRESNACTTFIRRARAGLQSRRLARHGTKRFPKISLEN